MKFRVEVDETIQTTVAYLVEAESEQAARAIIEDGEWDKTEVIATYNFDGSVNGIESITPVPEQ
jgi:hypothetical protein